MRLEKAFEQVNNSFENRFKKRYACAHCGKTWIEIVGLFALAIDEQEDTYLQAGTESEVCHNCKFNVRSCPACDCKDVYEIDFSTINTANSPMSFDRIRIVTKT